MEAILGNEQTIASLVDDILDTEESNLSDNLEQYSINLIFCVNYFFSFHKSILIQVIKLTK